MNSLPFRNLLSWNCTIIVLEFYGYRSRVHRLLYPLSKNARKYMTNIALRRTEMSWKDWKLRGMVVTEQLVKKRTYPDYFEQLKILAQTKISMKLFFEQLVSGFRECIGSHGSYVVCMAKTY